MAQLRGSPCISQGDVDWDCWVSYRDAQLVSDWLAGKIELHPEYIARACVTKESYLTGQPRAADVTLIDQYAEGLINTFPVCEILPGRPLPDWPPPVVITWETYSPVEPTPVPPKLAGWGIGLLILFAFYVISKRRKR